MKCAFCNRSIGHECGCELDGAKRHDLEILATKLKVELNAALIALGRLRTIVGAQDKDDRDTGDFRSIIDAARQKMQSPKYIIVADTYLANGNKHTGGCRIYERDRDVNHEYYEVARGLGDIGKNHAVKLSEARARLERLMEEE